MDQTAANDSDHLDSAVSSKSEDIPISGTVAPTQDPIVGAHSLSDSEGTSDEEAFHFLNNRLAPTISKPSFSIVSQKGDSSYTYRGTETLPSQTAVVQLKVYPNSAKYFDTDPRE